MLMGAAVAASLTLDTVHPSGLAALDAFPEPESGEVFRAAFRPAPGTMGRPFSLDAHLIRDPETTFLLRVRGHEFQEHGIQDGDLLVVDRTAAPSTGSLVVAIRAGQFCLARVGRDAQGQRILHTAQNAPLEPGPDPASTLTVWGVVRWNIHRLWPGRLSS